MDYEIVALRKGWDNSLATTVALEDNVLGLERSLTTMNRRNHYLQREVTTARVTCSKRDSLRIATLEARVVRMEEELRAKDKVIQKKVALLKEKEELIDTLDAALITKDGITEKLHQRLHWNYYNMVHLGARYYHARDLAERTQLAWEHLDHRRVMEEETLSAWVSQEDQREPRLESFELSPSRLCC